MLGRPLSLAPMEVGLELGLVRDDSDRLLAVGETNLPDGTKLMGGIRDASTDYWAQAKCTVANRRFALGGFSRQGEPLPQGWYVVEVCAHFNNAWSQPLHVLAMTGPSGLNLSGRLAQLLDPDVDDSDVAVDASFECPAPPASTERPLTPLEVSQAASVVQHATLSVQGHDKPRSGKPVGEVVEWFMSTPDLRCDGGWVSSEIAPGLVRVTYSYYDGPRPRLAEWHAMPRSRQVRYRNLAAKYMSWSDSGA